MVKWYDHLLDDRLSGRRRAAVARARPLRRLTSVPMLLAPRFWAMHLLALVLVAAAGWLGTWQYDAWQARRAAEVTDLTLVDPLPLDAVMGPDDPFPGDKVGQPVILGGTWVPEGTVYVSGREHDGDEGYWVVTPLAVGGPDAAALPIVREAFREANGDLWISRGHVLPAGAGYEEAEIVNAGHGRASKPS